MELKILQEELRQYSGVNLVYRCINLSKKKTEIRASLLQIALKECVRCGFLELIKNICSQNPEANSFLELTKEQEQAALIKNKALIDQKYAEIQNYKNLKKQLSVRISYYELGKLYFDLGCFKDAQEAFILARDYNPNDTTLVDIAYQLKKVQMISRNFEEKRNVIFKDVGFPSEANDELKNCYWLFKFLEAIHSINSKDFSYALKLFRENLKYFEDNSELKNFTSANDIAEYFLLLLMMSGGRSEVLKAIKDEKERNLIVKSKDAYSFIEFLSSLDYVAAMKHLHKIFTRLSFDPYIPDSADIMRDSVMERIIVQFLVPYKHICLAEVAATLGLQDTACQQILIKMIKQKQVPFLIDSINQSLVFVDPQKDKKLKLYRKGVKTISSYVDGKLLGLLRFKLNEIVSESNKHRRQIQGMDVEEFFGEEGAAEAMFLI